jgi:hypothetical protein
LKKVLERVAKRFLLHSNREFEEVKESDFDELKQNVQVARNELITDVRIIRESLKRYANIVHKGLSMLSEKHIKTNSGVLQENHFEKLNHFRSMVHKANSEEPSRNAFQLTKFTISCADNNANEREE